MSDASTSRRRFLTTAAAALPVALTLPTVAAAGDTAFLAVVTAFNRLDAEAQSRWDRGEDDLTSPDFALIHEQLSAVIDRLATTPAHTLPDLAAKLRIIDRYAREDCLNQVKSLMPSALADAERLAWRAAA